MNLKKILLSLQGIFKSLIIMKKENKLQKKLSLKKLQIMKINDMRNINGGNGFQNLVLEGQDDPQTPIRQTIKP